MIVKKTEARLVPVVSVKVLRVILVITRHTCCTDDAVSKCQMSICPCTGYIRGEGSECRLVDSILRKTVGTLKKGPDPGVASPSRAEIVRCMFKSRGFGLCACPARNGLQVPVLGKPRHEAIFLWILNDRNY